MAAIGKGETTAMIHILVMEDDKDLNETVCRHLSSRNCQTTGVLRAADTFAISEYAISAMQ